MVGSAEHTRGRIRRLMMPEFSQDGPVAHAPELGIRDIFRRFWPYARPYRAYVLLALPLIVVYPVIQTAMIWLFKIVVDDVLIPRDFGPFIWIALAYFGLTLLGGLITFVDSWLSLLVSQRFLFNLRTSVFRHVQDLSMGFFERRRLGDLVARLGGDIAAIEAFMLSGVASAISRSLRILLFAGALFYLRWDLALVALIVTPVFWYAARRLSRLVRVAAREERRREGSIASVTEEAFANASLVQAYNRQETESARFEHECRGSMRAEMASARLRALFGPFVELVELGGVLVVIALGTWEISQGRLSVGGLLVFLAYMGQLYRPVRGLTRLAGKLHAAAAGAERVAELLDEQPAVTTRVNATRLGRATGTVEFESVSFSYPGAETDALSDVSFGVGPSETLALVGASGAGKSTVAKLLLRFYDPRSGSIRMDGHDLRALDLHSLRENVALLLQETLVFDGSVRENIAYGRAGATQVDIEAAARAADAHDFIEALPAGYDTAIGQRGMRLSGGQRQRVAIARAMIRDAPLLILDEPTTGLDADSGGRILRPLKRLMAGRTTVVISHNLMSVMDATAIVVLDHGRITEVGNHAELLAVGGTYARLWRAHHPLTLRTTAKEAVA